MSNLLTVHQNLPALPVDATSDEVRKNLMDMFRDRQAFSEHTWKMLLSVCRSWAIVSVVSIYQIFARNALRSYVYIIGEKFNLDNLLIDYQKHLPSE